MSYSSSLLLTLATVASHLQVVLHDVRVAGAAELSRAVSGEIAITESDGVWVGPSR